MGRTGKMWRSWAVMMFTLAGCAAVTGAESAGEITASVNAMYEGDTFHGYSEVRVVLRNGSPTRPHNVTLVSPGQDYGNGNRISRLSRTVVVAPGAEMVVPLLQPPLPNTGDGMIRVTVDGDQTVQLRHPNANRHCAENNRYNVPATVLVSRSLDYDAVGRALIAEKKHSSAYTASQATGEPDATGYGIPPEVWQPDTHSYGAAIWLDLDYASPQAVTKIRIHQTLPQVTSGYVDLLAASGTNVAHLPLSAGRPISPKYSYSGYVTEFAAPTNSEPVKSVRLNFGMAPPSNIAIDAVQISGPTGNQWASDARASSDNNATASGSPRSGMPDTVRCLRAESGVADWSDNWLAYTPFDMIALGAGDLNVLPAPAAAALADYLEAGGLIVIFGAHELPGVWNSAPKIKRAFGIQSKRGLGNCFVVPQSDPDSLSKATGQGFREAATTWARYWQNLPTGGAAANEVLPVVENLKIPTRGIVIIMLLFILVIGPANIFILNRKNRRTWMLWTVPVISFLTTMLVFAYGLLREGITPDTRIAGLTLLDQARHHATTIGATGFYCPLTPSGGLHFDNQTEVTPLVAVGDWRSGSARDVDWTQSQHFNHGWVISRVPGHYHLRKSEPSRERLEVLHENGRLQIVNGLGAPIRSLWLADRNMNIYEARNLAAGQKAAPLPGTRPASFQKGGASDLFRDIGFAARNLTPDFVAPKYLVPGSYIAVLEGNPFLENALGSAASAPRTRTSCVVFGILEPADMP